jgi:hypothetical protein
MLARHGGNMPVIQALGKLRQEDHAIEASLAYTVRTYLKKNQMLLILEVYDSYKT